MSVAGKGEGSILEGVEKTKRNFWEISVSRLAESTTTDKIKSCLHEHQIEVLDVYLFNSKIKGCKSAKVRVALEHRDKVKDENVWPKHSRVQDWIYMPRSTRPNAIAQKRSQEKPTSEGNE